MLTRNASIIALIFTLTLAGSLVAQSESSGGWRTVDEPAPAAPPPPAEGLTVPAGTWVKIRVDQELSSSHNYEGDAFTATLTQPLVANGLVVARRGQTVGGRVAVADKGGRRKGNSKLGVVLTELSLADGRQVPVRTTLIEYHAGSSAGRDAAAVGTTTGLGAMIGAAADGGVGAGIGAIAGAAAGAIGVLSTRGKPTVIYPEAELTFRLEEPLTVTTDAGARAFHPATQQDYEQTTLRARKQLAGPRAPYYYYGGYYPPFWYGPSLYFYSGPRFFHFRGFGRRRW